MLAQLIPALRTVFLAPPPASPLPQQQPLQQQLVQGKGGSKPGYAGFEPQRHMLMLEFDKLANVNVWGPNDADDDDADADAAADDDDDDDDDADADDDDAAAAAAAADDDDGVSHSLMNLVLHLVIGQWGPCYWTPVFFLISAWWRRGQSPHLIRGYDVKTWCALRPGCPGHIPMSFSPSMQVDVSEAPHKIQPHNWSGRSRAAP
eukprot:scaffold91704_cov22-Tisochrysis_lutea.AAC.1